MPAVQRVQVDKQLRGPRGLPGVNGVPADEAVAEYLATGPETAPALDAQTAVNLGDDNAATHASMVAQVGGPIPLTRFGTGDPSDLIAAAIASGENDFYIPAGDYVIDETWQPPSGTRWTLARDATIIPATDFDVLAMSAYAQVQGGKINASSLASFTSAALLFSGHFPGGHDHVVSHMSLIGNSMLDAGSAAIRFECPGGVGQYIDWVKIDDMYLDQFEKLVHMDATTPGTWINGNRLTRLILVSAIDQLYIDGVGSLGADGNYFSWEGQSTTGGSRTIYCSGDFNTFDGWSFDVGAVGRTPLHAELTSASQRNVLNAPPTMARYTLDNGFQNTKPGGRGLEAHQDIAFEPAAANTRDPANAQPVGAKMVGDQDDFLAWSGRTGRNTIAQTAGNATTSDLSYMFNLDRTLVTTWNTTPVAADIVLELTMIENLASPKLMGLIFEFGQRPLKILVELINGGTTATAYSTTTNDKDMVTFTTNGLTVTSATMLRLTIGNPKNGTSIRLNRWWATAGDKPGRAWVSRNAPGITAAATTTAPAAGGAGALPATPAGYFTMSINGTDRKIPYY